MHYHGPIPFFTIVLQEERQRIYRAFFAATFAEMSRPPSYFKEVAGTIFLLLAAALPVCWLFKTYVLNPAPYQMHPQFEVRFLLIYKESCVPFNLHFTQMCSSVLYTLEQLLKSD